MAAVCDGEDCEWMSMPWAGVPFTPGEKGGFRIGEDVLAETARKDYGEVGDLVEYEYVIDHDPETLLPGYVDVSTFRFQSFDAPFHRSELIVVHPERMPIRVDARNGAP